MNIAIYSIEIKGSLGNLKTSIYISCKNIDEMIFSRCILPTKN
jgi:hypothetical protein